MPSLIDLATIDLRGAFDFAIMVEEDAQIRYEQLSRLMGNDPGGAGDVFRMMVVNEGKHRSQLVSRREALFREEPPRIQLSVMVDGMERPEVDDDELPRTAREALELTIAAEKRAYEFYRDLVPHVEDLEVRAFFQGLMKEEAEHGELLAKKVAQLDASPTGGKVRSAPQRQVVSAPADAYPDRAALESILPRFDAATQAVAVGVIVRGMAQEEVAAVLGVSRRAVASKLTQFLGIARRHVAVALAAAALTGCGGGFAMTDAPTQGTRAELRGDSVAMGAQDNEPTAQADGAGPAARGDLGERATEGEGGARSAIHPGAGASDLEFSAGLQEPPQQSVVPAPPAWTPPPDADASPTPLIEDVWPDKGPVTGGDHVVIRGKNLQAAQVLFGLVPGTIIEASEDHVTVAAPESDAGPVSIVVTNRDGNYAVGGSFQYYK
jgi:rubrerythrin